jgi:hypothetical protein
VLWIDDHMIAVGVVRKWRGAQGEAPHVRVLVRDLDEADAEIALLRLSQSQLTLGHLRAPAV